MIKGHSMCERCHHVDRKNKHNILGILCPKGAAPVQSVHAHRVYPDPAVYYKEGSSEHETKCSRCFCKSGDLASRFIIGELLGKNGAPPGLDETLKDNYQMKRTAKNTITFINDGKYRKFKLLDNGRIKAWIKIGPRWEEISEIDPNKIRLHE